MESNIIGRTIDSYQILDVLGRGGMGIVYRAKDLMLDKDVAVKMMDARLDPEGRLLKRFQEEARSLAHLQHPNIVAVYTLRESQLGLCIVMEFVKGRNLSDIIKEVGPLPLNRFKKIFLQCLNALDHAHTEGIIHRDIKPSNIMLTDQDVVKITDFGLAKRLDPTPNASTVLAGGTLYYSPPEQLDSLANVDYRGDIYSLGMTMYEALTGKIPFADTASDFRIRQAIVEGKIPSPETLRPDLPEDLVQLVMKAIHKDPAKRFRSAAAMAEALENCSFSVTKPARRTTSLFPVKTVAIALFLVAFALLAYLFIPKIFSSSPNPPSGHLTIWVRDQNGQPLSGASILIGPAKDVPEESVSFADAHMKQLQSGEFSTTSDPGGESRLAFQARPETRVQIVVQADSFSQAERTVALPQDSIVIVMTRLVPSRPRESSEIAEVLPSVIFLHDKKGNPVPAAIVTVQGRSGKEYAARTDPKGKAFIEDYPAASEGDSPAIGVAVSQFKTVLRGKVKSVRIRPGQETSLDINDLVPYDQTLSEMRASVENAFDDLRTLKDRFSGREKESGADPDFQQGQAMEQRGQRQFDQNDFEAARGSFQQAKVYYARAAEHLAAQGTVANADLTVKNPDKSSAEHSEPVKTEPVTREVAAPDMKGFLEKCKSSFEREDLTALSNLLRLNQKEQSTWSTFFDIADNVQVTTDTGKLQSDKENAQIGFGLTISYESKLDGERRKLEGDMSVGLHYTNGKWEVVSHQFKNR